MLSEPALLSLAFGVGAMAAGGAVLLYKRRQFIMKMGAQPQHNRRASDQQFHAIQDDIALLHSAIAHAQHGVALFSADFQLTGFNQRFIDYLQLPAQVMQSGAALQEMIYYVAARGDLGEGPAENLAQSRLSALMHSPETLVEQRLLNGGALEIASELIPSVGLVLTVADVSHRVLGGYDPAQVEAAIAQQVEVRTDELTRLNRALLRAKAESDIANMTKTKFLAAASHDVLQPLNAARLYAAALLERAQALPDFSRMAELVNSSLDAVEDILSSLLDVSRMDSGMLKPEMTDFALNDLIQQLMNDFEPAARKKGLKLRILPTELYVHSDRRLLRRILQNFISNALKYTPHGHVLVGVRRKNEMLRIDVLDTGPGITPEKLKVMFAEFERIGAETTQISGHGLGLSIVERIARLMQHKIDVDSVVGRGTRFSIFVPVAERPAHVADVALKTSVQEELFHNLNVVCVDNEPAIIEGMVALLRSWGANVIAAYSQNELAKLIAEHNFVPDVAVIDYKLDDGDTGLNVIAALRERFGASLPSALLTADRDIDIRNAAQEQDITMLYKPAKPAALKAFLKRIAMQKG